MTGKEPRYVDDPFEDEDLSYRSLSGIENERMVGKAFGITGRKYFRSPKEKRRWLLIDAQMAKATMPVTWVENCFDWARGKNKHRIIITLPRLINLILNKARMTDWLAEHSDEQSKQPRDYTID